jgi:MFS family permease
VAEPLSPRPDQPRPLPLRFSLGGLKRGFEALGVRNYRLYWSGQVVSLVGTWMQQLSLPWLVLALGGTPIQLGIVSMLEFGPSMLLAPFGGVFADRIDKRKAMLISQVAAALQAAALATIIALGVVTIPIVMVMGLILGIINAASMPVRQALAPELVPPRLLANAIALNSMAFNSARIVGPAVAGITIAAATALTGSTEAGVAINLGGNAITYGAVIVALWMMDPGQIRHPRRPERHPPVLDSLKEGFWYAVHAPLVLWPLVLLGGIAAFGFNFQILLPVLATDVLKLDADGYGLLFAAMGVGSLSGSLTLAFMRQRQAVPLIFLGGIAFVVFLGGIAASRSVWLVAPLVMAAGYFSMLMINTINATVQANVTDELRGRVMSLYVTVFAGSAPLGSIFAGAVAEAYGASAAFLVGAVISALVLAAAGYGVRRAMRRGPLGVTVLEGARGTGHQEPVAPDRRESPSAAA